MTTFDTRRHRHRAGAVRFAEAKTPHKHAAALLVAARIEWELENRTGNGERENNLGGGMEMERDDKGYKITQLLLLYSYT